MGFTPRRFAPTCACRAWGRLGGAQEPAHSEPSAPMSVNHKRSHCTGGKPNRMYPNDRKGRYCLRVAAVGGLHHLEYVGSWEVSHKRVGGTRLKPGPSHRARAA